MTQLNELLNRIQGLEKELTEELGRRRNELRYTIEKRKVYFRTEIARQHKEMAAKLSEYVYDSGFFIVLTIPIIWAPLIPAAILDLATWIYQLICFPIYGIPRVKRRDYVVIDRQALQYLNWLEKVNCMYCGYFNGLISFVREVAARTEQYWCPIRHARPVKSVHSRYRHFFEYGDAEGYRSRLAEVRKEYDDAE